MGLSKLEKQLAKGEITKAEFDRRVAQRTRDKQATKNVKFARKGVKNIRKLAIPENEQDRLVQRLVSVSDKPASLYLGALIMPKANMARIPDSFPRPTALVRSINVVDVMANFVGQPDDGRFALFIQPHLGAVDSPVHYKVGIVDSLGGWPADLTQAAQYVSNLAGSDPRLDPFNASLTQPGNFFFGWNLAFAAAVSNNLLGNAPPTLQAANYGLVVTQPSPGVFALPPGTYFVSYSAAGAGFTGLTTGGTATFTALASVLLANAFSFTGILQVTAAGQTWAPVSPSTAITVGNLSFSPIFTDAVSCPANFGAIRTLRPVAMSVLASCVLPELTNGGNIASAYVPPGAIAESFVTNSVQTVNGCLANWENLARLPDSYNGPLKTGTYAWWAPEDFREVSLLTPDELVQEEYPTLVVAGQWTPGTTPPGNTGTPVRLEIVTIYEFTTTSLLYEQMACVGNQALLDTVNLSLAGQPHCMPNGQHWDWLKGMAKKAAQFFRDNQSWIIPAAKAGMSLLA